MPPPKPEKVEMPRLLENPFTGEKIESDDTMSMGKGFYENFILCEKMAFFEKTCQKPHRE